MNILEFFGSMPSSYVDYLHIFNGMKSEKSTIKGSCTTYHGLNVYFFWMSTGPIEACRQCKLQWRIYWSNRAHILFYCTIFVLSAHSADHLKGILYWNKHLILRNGWVQLFYCFGWIQRPCIGRQEINSSRRINFTWEAIR